MSSKGRPAQLQPDLHSLSDLLAPVLPLRLLQFLEQRMQPHHRPLNLVDLALLLDQFIDARLLKQPQEEDRSEVLSSLPLQTQPKLARNLSEKAQQHSPLQLRREETFQLLLEQLKTVFLYYAAQSLSYEMINEYVYNQQLNCLANRQVDEDYLDIGEKRVRIDENLKLCIMPLTEEGLELRTTKLKQLVFRENRRGAELEAIYVVTSDYIRGLHIQPELIGIASDFHRKGDPQPCWYSYEGELIRPKRSTLSVLSKAEEGTVLSSAELRELRATAATNLEEKFSEQLLSILKASLSENLMGIISLDQSFLVEPVGSGRGKVVQGYIGNLLRDVPPEIALGGSRDKYEEILLFHPYGDTEWLILTSRFLYLYRIPLPAENIILREQNNLNRASGHQRNPLLLMCQRLPKGCLKAVPLHRPFLALMLESNAVVIVKLVVNSLGVFEGRPLNLEMNYFKITNKIYNDIQFKCLCFNPAFNTLFLSDFGAYLIRIAFNPTYGDIEEEGVTHDRSESSLLNQEMIRNSYAQLRATRQRARSGTIPEAEEEEDDTSEPHIQVHYLKPSREQERSLFSLYKKQSASPHTVIIKNQTRQVITFLATNRNYNTLVTYEAEPYEKKTGSEFQGERYREWGNRNKIKLWDIRHMTIYKTYDISVEIAFLELRANGLFAITAQRGYLVFYPFNEDRKALLGEAEQRLLDQASRQVSQELEEVFLERNSLFFSTLTTAFNKHSNLKVHQTRIYELQLQRFPAVRTLQTLPSEVSALAVSSRLYVLENSSAGVEASQLHVYNRLGLKEEMLVFSNPESVNAQGRLNLEGYNQEYKHLRRIDHPQFQAVLWNADSLKMIGSSPEESYTIVFSSQKVNRFGDTGERIRNIRDIQVLGEAMVVYCENTTRIRQRSHMDTASRLSESSERGSQGRERVHEQVDNSLLLISNHSDRITFRLQHISPRIKVLHMFNSLLLTREEDAEFDLIKVLDVGDHGPLIEKLLFSAKFRRASAARVQARDFREEEFYELDGERNLLLQELKEYSVRKLVTLEDTKVAVTKSNKLLVLLVFKVETHYVDLLTRKTVRSELEFMVYTRNISDELLNRNYKISKIQVGKKTQKHLYEYQTSSSRAESIFGHKVLSIDDCLAISNYTEIDMQQLCEAIDSEEGRQFAGIDITDKILAPRNINDNHIRDIYEVLSLKRDEKLFKLFQQHPSPISAINAFSFKIVEFSDQELTGTIAISNKLLRTIGLYTFELDCRRKDAAKRLDIGEQPQDPYQLQLLIQKVALVAVKSHREIQREEEIKRAEPSLSKQEVQHVNILEWNTNYKTKVEEMWENTIQNLKSFIAAEKTNDAQHRRSISLPPIGIHKLSTPLQIKKRELMKHKLSTSERNHPPEPAPKELETEGASLMFKKWTISQAIQLEKTTRDANNITEIKAVNRYVNRVLKSEEDTAERIQSLIRNSRMIKEASQVHISISNTERDRTVTLPSEGGETNRRVNVTHLDNILRSSQIAKQSNIKTYLQQKNLRTITHAQSKQDYTRLSRNETNKSSLTTEIEKCSLPLRSDSKSDIRLTNMSKLSNHTNRTKRSKHNPTPLQPASHTLDNKIRMRLEEMAEKSISDKKIVENLKFYTPERSKEEASFNMSRLKTDKSRYDNTSPNKKSIRFATQQTDEPNKSSQYDYTLSITPEQDPRSPARNNKFQDYKNNFSLLAYKNKQDSKPSERQSSPQTDDLKRQLAVERLKRSQQLMNEVYLPEIASTKEKLMKKMKEKRSYVKTIQAHLNDSSLLAIREGDKRKALIKQLHEFK